MLLREQHGALRASGEAKASFAPERHEAECRRLVMLEGLAYVERRSKAQTAFVKHHEAHCNAVTLENQRLQAFAQQAYGQAGTAVAEAPELQQEAQAFMGVRQKLHVGAARTSELHVQAEAQLHSVSGDA